MNWKPAQVFVGDEFWVVRHRVHGPGGSCTTHAVHDYPNKARLCMSHYEPSPLAVLAYGAASPEAQPKTVYRVALGVHGDIPKAVVQDYFPGVSLYLFAGESGDHWFAEFLADQLDEARAFAEHEFSVWPARKLEDA